MPWRIGEKEKAMEVDRLHEDEVLSLSWIRLTRGTGISLVWLRELTFKRNLFCGTHAG